MATMKDICEYIVKADILTFPDGSKPTAQDIWNSSPTGELFHIFAWYELAKQVLGDGGV